MSIHNPKLRFKREDGTVFPEWGNKSFANAFAPLNNNTFSRDMLAENGMVLNIHYGDILVKFGEVCDIQAMDIPKVNADIDTSKYDVLQDGDIILADTAEDETVGKAIEIYHTGTSKVVSGLHTMACRPNDKYAPKYMGYYINSPTYHNQLLPFMQGIKVTSIGRKNIADTVIYYPTDLEEQQKIADFLSTVDEVIAQSEVEVQNLEQQKKAAMQKIFSQEVRFKREDGTEYPEWEEKKLGELVTSANKDKVNTSQYKKITIGLHKRGLSYSTVHEDMADTRPFYRRYEGELIIGKQNYFNGSIAIVSDEFDGCICSNAIMSFIFNSCVNGRFLYEAISRDTYLIYHSHLAEGGGQKELSEKKFLEMTVVIPPDIEEQQKIADFLSAYDEAISYVKLEFEHWKQLKKGLLQQMFV